MSKHQCPCGGIINRNHRCNACGERVSTHHQGETMPEKQGWRATGQRLMKKFALAKNAAEKRLAKKELDEFMLSLGGKA